LFSPKAGHEIGQHDMGGRVRTVASRQNLPDDLPVYPSQALSG
jgi:hypothetical protein